MTNQFEVGHAKRGGRQIGTPNKASKDVRELARSHGRVAIRIAVKIAKNPNEPSSVRLAACALILDRGFGKAQQVVTGDDAAPITVIHRVIVDTVGDQDSEGLSPVIEEGEIQGSVWREGERQEPLLR